MTDNKWTCFKVTGDYNTDIRSLYESWATTQGIENGFYAVLIFIPFRAV